MPISIWPATLYTSSASLKTSFYIIVNLKLKICFAKYIKVKHQLRFSIDFRVFSLESEKELFELGRHTQKIHKTKSIRIKFLSLHSNLYSLLSNKTNRIYLKAQQSSSVQKLFSQLKNIFTFDWKIQSQYELLALKHREDIGEKEEKDLKDKLLHCVASTLCGCKRRLCNESENQLNHFFLLNQRSMKSY